MSNSDIAYKEMMMAQDECERPEDALRRIARENITLASQLARIRAAIAEWDTREQSAFGALVAIQGVLLDNGGETMNFITVNGRDFSTPDEHATYDYIVTLAFGSKKRIDAVYAVTYTTRRKGDEQRAGTLMPGPFAKSVPLEDGMVFDAVVASNA